MSVPLTVSIKLYLETVDHPLTQFLAGVIIGEFREVLPTAAEDTDNDTKVASMREFDMKPADIVTGMARPPTPPSSEGGGVGGGGYEDVGVRDMEIGTIPQNEYGPIAVEGETRITFDTPPLGDVSGDEEGEREEREDKKVL